MAWADLSDFKKLLKYVNTINCITKHLPLIMIGKNIFLHNSIYYGLNKTLNILKSGVTYTVHITDRP